MRRALVWTIGLVVVLGGLALLWTLRSRGTGEEPAPPAAPSAASAPAPRASPAVRPGLAGGETATAPAEIPPAGAAAPSYAEQNAQLTELRQDTDQRFQEMQAAQAALVAELRKNAEERRAKRAFDPNRPPPERLDPGFGPGIVPGSVKPKHR